MAGHDDKLGRVRNEPCKDREMLRAGASEDNDSIVLTGTWRNV